MNIPSLDLNDYLSTDLKRRNEFIQELGNAYTSIGFAAIKNHYLSPKTESELYRLTKAFFSLPETVKKKYEIEGMAGQRGYTSFGTEHAKNSDKGDLKEFFHFGQVIEDEDPALFNYPNNLVIEDLPDFEKIGMEAYRALEKTGKYMLRAMAEYLKLDPYYFDDKIKNGNSILRPIHYGPIMNDPKGAVRAGEHEDINLITLLMGASADGLEILNKQNKWIAVTALPDHIVVNVGDMLQRLTNNVFCSTTHRVVNPPREQWHLPRFSIPFFLHPRSEVKLDCLENCITPDNPCQYPPITSGDFLIERLKEIGLIK